MSWAKNKIVTRLGDQIAKLRRSPYLLMSCLSLLLIVLLGWLFSRDLIYLLKSGIKTWEDARGVGLFKGGVVASPIAFLSLHIGDRKIQEQEVQNEQLKKQNKYQEYETSITKLVQAFNLIDEVSEPQRILGLALLRQSELQHDRPRLDAALTAISAFTRRHWKRTTSFNREEGQRLTWNSPEASEALHSLLFLSTLRFVSSNTTSMVLHIHSVDFALTLLEQASFNASARFFECDFGLAQFQNVEMVSITFHRCDFSAAKFSSCKLERVRFFDCDISSLSTDSEDSGFFTNLFSKCNYLADKPPTVPTGTLLPVPDVMDIENNVQRRKMTYSEARRWGDPRLIPKFDENGELIAMEYKDGNPPTEKPKPDPAPDLDADIPF